MQLDEFTANLGSIGKEAIEMFNSAPTSGTTETAPAAPSAVVAPVTSEQPSTPALQTTPAVAAPPTSGQAPASAAETKLFEVDFGNGRVEKLTEAQVKEAYQNGLRQQDYTRKTQDLARQRAEVDAVYQQLQAQIQRQQLAQRQQPPVVQQQEAQTPIDPTAPMTVGQAMALAQAFQERIQQVEQGTGVQAQQLREQAQQYVEDRLQMGQYAETINATLGDIYQKNPILKALPEMEDIMRFRVSQLEPATIEETQEAFRTVGQQLAQQVESTFAARQQQAVVQRAALTTQGIEPPGGAVPQPPVQSYRTSDNKLDWERLRRDALQLTQQQ